MDIMNFDDNLSKIKMEKAKNAAKALNESWGGNQNNLSNKSAGSYSDGFQKEIAEMSEKDIKIIKPEFSLGILETAMALAQTSFSELSEGKMLIEKYINHITIRSISEAFLIEGIISDLENFSWENNAKSALCNLKSVYEKNKNEIQVAKAIEEIRRSPGKSLFSDITETMKKWLSSNDRIIEKLLIDLKKWGFNPTVRSLVESLTKRNTNPDKFNLSVNSENCSVIPIIAPSLVYENHSIFVTSNRFFKANSLGISVMERGDTVKLPSKFLKSVLALSNENVKLNENGLDFYIGKNKLSVIFESETNTKTIIFNSKQVSPEKLGLTLSMVLRNSFNSASHIVEEAISIVEGADYLSNIDFGKKLVSKIYEGVEANIFKFGEKIYINRVNPSMKKNELLESNGNQAVTIIKEFLGFDISESMTDILQKEDRILSIMKNDKEAIRKNLAILEGEMNKIKEAISKNPSFQQSDEIKEAQLMINRESDDLRSRWNQINVEIERFEKGYKKAKKVNESEGYGINTEIKIKRNGEKGKVVGINGNSKTYTVMMENGTTGEFFFNDVINISDELSNSKLEKVGDITEDNDLTNEGLENEMELAEAPEKIAKKPVKFIDKEKTHNLAKAPGAKTGGSEKDIEDLGKHALAEAPDKKTSKEKNPMGISGNFGLAEAPDKKSGSNKKFIDNEKIHNLAKAPGENTKTQPKFIENLKDAELAESQKNLNIEKAPSGKKIKSKKFIENLKDAELAEAPGNHKKNGKKYHEPLKRAELAKAPQTKKK